MATFLTVASGSNRPGRSDSTGVFSPYAECFRRMHHPDQPVHYFKSEWTPDRRRRWFREVVKNAGHFECFSFFGHGYTNGLQLGFVGKERVSEFADMLGEAGVTHALFYACLMGERGLPLLIGSRCKTLRLCFSHMSTTPAGSKPRGGHAVWNPKVRIDVWGNDRSVETFLLDNIASAAGTRAAYRGALQASAKTKDHYAFRLPFLPIWETSDEATAVSPETITNE